MPLHVYFTHGLASFKASGIFVYSHIRVRRGKREEWQRGGVWVCVHWPPLRARNLGGWCRPAGARHGASRSLSVCWCCADGSSRSQLLVRTKTPLFSDFSCIHDSSFYRFIFIYYILVRLRGGPAGRGPHQLFTHLHSPCTTARAALSKPD